MHAGEFTAFRKILSKTLAFYDKQVSAELADAWFDALSGYSLEEVGQALQAHIRNPDTGQFPPKPADVVKCLYGGLEGVSQHAWTKVAKAVGSAGPWRSVAFDDAIIHRVLDDMGGWVRICSKSGEEWPFTQKEFVQRYRAIAVTMQVPDYPPYLIGTAEAENNRRGLPTPPASQLALIGNKAKAQLVVENGSFQPAVKITMVAHEGQNLRIGYTGADQEAPGSDPEAQD